MTKLELHVMPKTDRPWWAMWLWESNNRISGGNGPEARPIEELIDAIRAKGFDLPCSIEHVTWGEPGTHEVIYTILAL